LHIVKLLKHITTSLPISGTHVYCSNRTFDLRTHLTFKAFIFFSIVWLGFILSSLIFNLLLRKAFLSFRSCCASQHWKAQIIPFHWMLTF
jgi:hypothetical protein